MNTSTLIALTETVKALDDLTTRLRHLLREAKLSADENFTLNTDANDINLAVHKAYRDLTNNQQ